MRDTATTYGRARTTRIVFVCVVTMAMLVASLAAASVITETADARGPEYSGPQTQPVGPAFFGPAPNPFPYCDSPTYFDPFPENVNPIGRMDIGNTAAVTTDGITMTLEITAEGNPGTQYPGFFPLGSDGVAGDQAKGVEMAEGDGAGITLSQPLFYSQWIFTDVDQPDEGFNVNPRWTQIGEAAAFGGDNNFTFVGSTTDSIELDDTDGVGTPSESINGRVQVDFLGAVTGIDILRTFPSDGQSGFAVGGGCEAAGTAKVLTAGPTWNGTSFDVTYELRVRNNLPSSATIQEAVTAAQAAVGASFVTGTPQGIPLTNLQLTDTLTDPAFSAIEVTGLTQTGGLDLNETYNGQTDVELLDPGATLAAESDGVITLSVAYTPDLTLATWTNCTTGYDYLNQSTVSGSAANVGVSDVSDNGTDASPSADNGAGGVDDPTPVLFPCLPAGLEIVKTVVNGPNGTCPTFANGVPGDGPPLQVLVDDTVTYCIAVRNPGIGTATNVVISDPQGPGDFAVSDLASGQTAAVSYDVQVNLSTPTTNTATATGTDALGPLGPVSDTAVIAVSPKPQPNLEIVKTVVAGPNGVCPTFDNGVAGLGTALAVTDGDTVTYCISVRNTGPGDATNVVVTDAQAPQDYLIGTLSTNQGQTVSYDIAVTQNTPTVNTAVANGNGPDGPVDPVEDPAQIVVSAKPQPNLEIVKTVIPGPNGTCPTFTNGVPGLGNALTVNDGDTVTYCVSIRNTGPGEATDVVVRDEQAPGVVSIASIAGGAEAPPIRYDVTVGATTPTTNTAFADGNGPDGPLPRISDPAQIAVTPPPALEIVKTALRGPNAQCPDFAGGVAGLGPAVNFVETEFVTYCVTVRNSGQSPATNVVITDDQAPNSFDLTVGNLAPGASATRQFDLQVSLQTPTVNTATVNGDGPNAPIPSSSDPAQIAVSLQPDPVLEIVKTVVAGPNGACPTFANGVPGDGPALPVLYPDTVTYCVSVRNTGANAATSVTVTDAQAPGVLQLGTIAIGGEETRSYDVVVDANTPALNTATVDGFGPNGQVPSDSDTALIEPEPKPDPVLEIVKTVVAGPNGTCPSFDDGTVGRGTPLEVEIGDTVTYCIAIRNTGGGDAQNVRITDAQAPASPYEIGNLASGASASRSYDLVIDANTPLVNVATVTGDGPNGPIDEDEDDAEIVNPPEADLAIVKSVSDAGPVPVGTLLTYTLVITNNGPDTASGVSVDDVLPAGLDYAGLPGDADWACSLGADGRTFSCLKATDMANGDSVTLSYTVTVAATAGPGATLVNTATVKSRTPDTDLTNNNDTSLTSTPPDQGEPLVQLPEYPGPFDPPPAPPAPPLSVPPDEVLGLALTGTSSNLLGLISALMLSLGGMLTVGARRSRRDRY